MSSPACASTIQSGCPGLPATSEPALKSHVVHRAIPATSAWTLTPSPARKARRISSIPRAVSAYSAATAISRTSPSLVVGPKVHENESPPDSCGDVRQAKVISTSTPRAVSAYSTATAISQTSPTPCADPAAFDNELLPDSCGDVRQVNVIPTSTPTVVSDFSAATVISPTSPTPLADPAAHKNELLSDSCEDVRQAIVISTSTPKAEYSAAAVISPTSRAPSAELVGPNKDEVSIKLAVEKCVFAAEPDDVVHVLASVQTPSGAKEMRQPSNVVCVIDVSGSMSTEAKIRSLGGVTESHGLSLLDVAKHGVRTIIKTLGADDRVSIISFNLESRVVFPLAKMDTVGQRQAEEALDTLIADGGTDIWKGLKSGLDELRNEPENESFGHIMLLTDGKSVDRESINPKLVQYRELHERLPGTINTFGFGYKLDSALLVSLAETGSGSYSFIPDAGFVGTAFVNAISNLLVTMAREVYLTLSVENGATIVEGRVNGGYPAQVINHSDLRVNLGTLQYGQTKDIVIPVRILDPAAPFLVARVQYETPFGSKEEPPFVEADGNEVHAEQVEIQRCRCLFADTLREAVEIAGTSSCEEGLALLAEATAEVRSSSVRDNDIVQKLLEDMQGQSAEALSKKDWFKKWGCHYLPSVMFAHRLQQCNNFKDPGVQVYGGELCKALQDMADDLFNQLPPPKPSVQRRSSTTRSAPASMAAYNDRYCG